MVFYDQEGHQSQQFDYSADDSAKEFSVAQYNPTGDTVVVGAFDRFYIYSFSLSRQSWEESGVKVYIPRCLLPALCAAPGSAFRSSDN